MWCTEVWYAPCLILSSEHSTTQIVTKAHSPRIIKSSCGILFIFASFSLEGISVLTEPTRWAKTYLKCDAEFCVFHWLFKESNHTQSQKSIFLFFFNNSVTVSILMVCLTPQDRSRKWLYWTSVSVHLHKWITKRLKYIETGGKATHYLGAFHTNHKHMYLEAHTIHF